MSQHKSGAFEGFTKKYKIDRLMYFESYSEPKAAAARELQIKGYRREENCFVYKKQS